MKLLATGSLSNSDHFVGQMHDQLKSIAMLVGEGGIYSTDPGAATFFGTMTSAANALGVSWSVSAFEGELGIYYSDGTPKPYAQIVIDAANAPY